MTTVELISGVSALITIVVFVTGKMTIWCFLPGSFWPQNVSIKPFSSLINPKFRNGRVTVSSKYGPIIVWQRSKGSKYPAHRWSPGAERLLLYTDQKVTVCGNQGDNICRIDFFSGRSEFRHVTPHTRFIEKPKPLLADVRWIGPDRILIALAKESFCPNNFYGKFINHEANSMDISAGTYLVTFSDTNDVKEVEILSLID